MTSNHPSVATTAPVASSVVAECTHSVSVAEARSRRPRLLSALLLFRLRLLWLLCPLLLLRLSLPWLLGALLLLGVEPASALLSSPLLLRLSLRRLLSPLLLLRLSLLWLFQHAAAGVERPALAAELAVVEVEPASAAEPVAAAGAVLAWALGRAVAAGAVLAWALERAAAEAAASASCFAGSSLLFSLLRRGIRGSHQLRTICTRQPLRDDFGEFHVDTP